MKYGSVLTGIMLAGALACGTTAALADGMGASKAASASYSTPSAMNWGGLYIGANAGWVSKNYDWAFNPPLYVDYNTFSVSQDEGIYGGHIGLQHQWGRIVVGIEAAYTGTRHDWASHEVVSGYSWGDVRTGPLFTLGPRLGVTMHEQLMVYLSGGYATANVLTRGHDIYGVVFEETTQRHHGGYIGAGLEWALRSDLILGVEYQHVFLGDQMHTAYEPRTVDVDMDIVRARVSWKIGRAEAAHETLK